MKLIVVCFLSVLSANAFAAWEKSTVSNKDQINKVCEGDSNFRVDKGDLSTATVYKNKSSTFIACHANEEKPEYLTAEYLLKYNLGSKPEILHGDAEMMTWGASVDTKGDLLTVKLYWPSERKPHRQVREFTLDCTKSCQFHETCAVERLKSDLKPDDLIAQSESRSKTERGAADLGEGRNEKASRLMDQLFFEALTGNQKARSFLNRLATKVSGAAASSEILGTYIDFLKDLEAKKCHWAGKD
jgi:hypothetical protein